MPPRNEDFDYDGVKTIHSGGWDANAYHHPNNQHHDRLKAETEKRSLKPISRKRSKIDSPKPVTKTVDLATNTKTVVDEGLNQAHQNDLKTKGLK